jgi:histidinol-phosphate aminotransferase
MWGTAERTAHQILTSRARPATLAIEPYVWEAANHEVAARYGLDPARVVRFDTNTSPLPPPCLEAVLDRVRAEPYVNEYFDGSYAALGQALADYTGYSPDHFVIGAGADEILDVLAKTFLNPGDRVVIHAPTYALYRIVSTSMDAEIQLLPAQPDLSFDPDALIAAGQDAKAIFLCNPNNPTGRMLPISEVGRIVRGVPCLVIVDEAYAEFAGESALDLVREEPRLIIVRTLSKAFALAGARIGYAVCDPEAAGLANRMRPPNSIAYVSAVLAETALRDLASMRGLVAMLLGEREWLAAELAALGRPVVSSAANFVLAQWPSREAAAAAHEACLREGMVLRYYPDNPLLSSYLRITARTRANNQALVAALRRTLGR